MSSRHCERLHAAAVGGIDRRTFLAQLSSAAGATLLLPVIGRSATLAADGPVTETSAGNILGVSAGGVHAFKGVPYGAPTSGRNRFMPPQKPNPWSGIRSATDWAGRAPQAPSSARRRPELSGLSGAPDRVTESEDCLTLNVWTRGLKDGGKRPIMVWYHGGGFSYGSANTPRLDGGNLAALYDSIPSTRLAPPTADRSPTICRAGCRRPGPHSRAAASPTIRRSRHGPRTRLPGVRP